MQPEIIEGYRLSPQQKHLWLLQQSDRQTYRTQFALLIEGNLDIKTLEIALQKVVARHEILRTNFCFLPGMTIPLQVISDRSTVSIQYEICKDANIQKVFIERLKTPLDLTQSSLLDISLINLSSQQNILLISLPSLCADRANIDNFVRELSHLYTACLDDKELSDELTQYADISEWQNELLEAEDTKSGIEYWCKQDLSNALNLKLPIESKSKQKKQFQPHCLSYKIDSSLLGQLEAIAQKYDCSISDFLLTCWFVILWRFTRQDKITLGRAFDGRKYEELERSLGLLEKYLPLSCHLNDRVQFQEILKKVEQATVEIEQWQEYFSWENVKLEQNNPSLTFFPVCFDFWQQPQKYYADEISFAVIQQYVCCDRFNLKLSCLLQDASLTAEFHYDSTLFDIAAIERLASHFQTLLASAINCPEAEIGQLEILNQSDRNTLLVEFNQTQTDYSQERCIHQLFEAQATQTPDNIAVVFEDRQLTYAELNRQANQLAHRLQRLGVTSEVLVGLFVERSLEFIVGLLGILKAGGAYLPLDPGLPQDGVAFRLQDAQVKVLLTQQHLVESLSHSGFQLDAIHVCRGAQLCAPTNVIHTIENCYQSTAQIIYLDTDWQDIATESDKNLTSEVKPENLVYVLFTSGSTGKPKGVAVEHRQLLNYINAIAQRLDLSTCNSFAAVSTFAADLGNTTIFPCLCSGGCLHVISSERAANPEALADYFHRHPIDCLKIVPSHLSALLTASRPERILPRQRLILGGETCSWQLIEQIQQLSTCQIKIFNHYGPTEATVGATTFAIAAEQTKQVSQTVPLGRPLANTQIYLLDPNLQLVPIGVPGELYIGGAGVARGYLNRPDLTQERFIPNPFWESRESESREQGALRCREQGSNSEFKIQNSKLIPNSEFRIPNSDSRLYKTGDLARYLPDGNIEFLGRIDRQVKIHGFRIELGEIEAALRQHPAIRETVVVAREDRPDIKHLVAYIVPKKQSVPTTSELREFLQQQLPEYMVPSAFVKLKAMPLLPNGKVDLQALPAAEAIAPETDTFAAPRTTVEKMLAEIWQQILGLEQVGIYNNFFELGGDSILNMQVVAKANQAGLQLTPKQLFENQTIAELAAAVGKHRVISAEQGIVTGRVPLTPIQQRFFAQNLPDSHHWNQSVLLEVRQIDPALLKQAVQKLLEYHDALRLRFVRQESVWQQFNADFNGIVPFTQIDLSALSPAEQREAIASAANEIQTSLDLSSGSLIRVAFFDLGASQPSRLLIVIHHLAVDGVSWRILLSDLQTIYQQLSRGETIQLPPKTTAFKHWAERLTDYARSPALQRELEYWLAVSRQQTTRLPIDFPDGENTVAQARTVAIALSREETQALLQEVPAAAQTQIGDVLLAALAPALKQWTGANSHLIDLEGHGREAIFDDVDLSRTVGWFTTIFPVLLDLGAEKDLGDTLKTVKQQLRAIPNRGIGYGVLRYLSGSQLGSQAEIQFNYLGQSDRVFQSSLFAPAYESCGAGRSPRGSRAYLLDINGIVAEGQLQLDWTYSEAIHRRATIENLANSFLGILRQLIAYCQSLKAVGYKPANLPDVVPAASKITAAVLNAEAELDAAIRPETSFQPTVKPTRIFLTGATGFLGAFLLHELLQQTDTEIYCLVRAANLESGKQKIQNNLASYLLWHESLSDRIIPVVGDLSQPLLGLTDEQFQLLASAIDVIYHNGAAINLVYPYSALKATNVLGTQEVLRLASQTKVKPVHYISTLSVLSANDRAETRNMRELYECDRHHIPSFGYAQTKWVAEKLVATAQHRGIPACIYRLGRISGDSKTGVCNTNDRLYRTIKGIIQLGYAPALDTTVDMTPVDYLSKAIVHLSQQEKSGDRVFHLCHPHPWRWFELTNWMRSFGYPLQPIDYKQFQAELLNEKMSPDNPLYPLIPFFSDRDETESSSSTPASDRNTSEELADIPIACPPIDTQLLNNYFSYLIQSGFLDAPHSNSQLRA
ncbi:non-ribosomal peptide synthetase [Chroococcidiopsis sp. CCALA 051]|uniref:non-ribosomal peptide synthetase n=1 Tax=Chroococcidiopsis sp. CCALA 051 TaxID=869949 RepID=UPI0018EE3EF7|nr:non-ribosomal peptide synthetase [Chroococcidiopsis sp. CCALA 051]